MDEDLHSETARVPSKKERADAFTKALGEAARRTRLSKKNKQHLATDRYKRPRNEKLFRRVRYWSFIALFLIPSLAVILYYTLLASDEFTAETRFTVRGGAPAKLDTIGALTGLPPALIMQDTHVILNFVLSRAMVESLDKSVGLRQLFSKPSIDFFSRMDAAVPIEKVVKYWKSMLDFSVHMPAGIVVLRVHAYSADDAKRIADAMLAACENLVNAMNERIINDTLATSEAERLRAEANLATARARLESSRNMEGLLSAERVADALNGLILKLRSQLSQMQQEYAAQRRYVAEDAPQMRDLNIRIDAANEELKLLQAHLTGTKGQDGSAPLTAAMSNLDYLNLENRIAEKIYASSLVLLEHAHLASEAKLLYLNVFVKAVPSEKPDYSHNRFTIMLFVFANFAVWIIFTLIFGVLNKMRLRPFSLGV
jgi:capsular polysaccharide transport system permease protein